MFPRYKTMRGCHCPRRVGRDTHGLPVEHEVEKELGIFDKPRIEREAGVEESTRRCCEPAPRAGELLLRKGLKPFPATI